MGFANNLKKLTKGLSFGLKFNTSLGKQNILYTLLGVEIDNITFSSLSLFMPTIILSLQTQRLSIEATTRCFTLSFEPWTTDRKRVNAGKGFQLVFGSSSNNNASLSVITAHQKKKRVDHAYHARNLLKNRLNNAILIMLILENILLESMVLEIRRNLLFLFTLKLFYLYQYRDLNLF